MSSSWYYPLGPADQAVSCHEHGACGRHRAHPWRARRFRRFDFGNSSACCHDANRPGRSWWRLWGKQELVRDGVTVARNLRLSIVGRPPEDCSGFSSGTGQVAADLAGIECAGLARRESVCKDGEGGNGE